MRVKCCNYSELQKNVLLFLYKYEIVQENSRFIYELFLKKKINAYMVLIREHVFEMFSYMKENDYVYIPLDFRVL